MLKTQLLHTIPFDYIYERSSVYVHDDYIFLTHNLIYNAFHDPTIKLN